MTEADRVAVERCALVALVIALLAGCGSAVESESVEPTTLILVRHAEKGPGEPDPDLTPEGLRRAELLASMLAEVKLSAVYSSSYRRTQQTAAPTAKEHRLTVIEYSAKERPSAILGEILAAHRGGAVLVVGHSNTIPGMIAALTGEPESGHLDGYEDLFVVTFAELGDATVIPLRYALTR